MSLDDQLVRQKAALHINVTDAGRDFIHALRVDYVTEFETLSDVLPLHISSGLLDCVLFLDHCQAKLL